MVNEWDCIHMKKCGSWNATAIKDDNPLMYCPCPFKKQPPTEPSAPSDGAGAPGAKAEEVSE